MFSIFFVLCFLPILLFADDTAIENSKSLLSRYHSALLHKNENDFNEITDPNFKLYGCDQQVRGNFLWRSNFWEKIEEFPSDVLKVHQIEIDEAKEFGNQEVIARGKVNGVKVEFSFRVQEDGRYLLYREKDYDCANRGILTTVVIDYQFKIAEIAQKLVDTLVTGFTNRNFDVMKKAIDDPYNFQFCTSNGDDFNTMTFPCSGIDIYRKKTLVEISEAKYHLNQSITFSVHGNDKFEATKRDDGYKLKYHRHLQCMDSVPTKVNIEEIQYTVFYKNKL